MLPYAICYECGSEWLTAEQFLAHVNSEIDEINQSYRDIYGVARAIGEHVNDPDEIHWCPYCYHDL